MKEYSKGIYVKFKPEEVEMIHERMKEAGAQNMSAFIRKMVLNGYMIIPEWPDLDQVISLHSRISNNLNQYAIKNICEDLNCGTQKACKLLDELEKVGALERKRQGLGRPNKLYLKKMF